jgi:hypothetical protein
MEKRDILICVKTYPEMSAKYTETVCTAGIRADTKQMVRLYPIRFRYLEGVQQFKKYQWIRASISKAARDPRPESYNINPDTIELGDVVPASKYWEERRALLLNENTVFPSVEALREDQKQNGTSLGVVKPKAFKRIDITKRDEKEVDAAILKKDGIVKQLDMFEEKKDLYILPVRFMIEFTCDIAGCTGHRMSILDWEFGQLYRKVQGKPDWQERIKSKVIDEICSGTRDTHVILGNMAGHPQTFCILGFFWPPILKARQQLMFA